MRRIDPIESFLNKLIDLKAIGFHGWAIKAGACGAGDFLGSLIQFRKLVQIQVPGVQKLLRVGGIPLVLRQLPS